MHALSYTRLTLALDIVRKLTSGPLAGYHELAVVKHQIDLADTITMEEADATAIKCGDPRVPCDSRNICWQAVELVRKEFGIDRHALITIDKRIPVMGGLAGGSANAATTLAMLNELWQLGLDRQRLAGLGRRLGMDVPYYFTGGTALDSETTDQLQPVPTTLVMHFVLAVPGFGVSTRDAYAGLDYGAVGRDRHKTAAMLDALGRGDWQGVAECAHNDFETSVFRHHPALSRLKARLAAAGCAAVFMSGSGSTLVGMAADGERARHVCDFMAGDPDAVSVMQCMSLPRACGEQGTR